MSMSEAVYLICDVNSNLVPIRGAELIKWSIETGVYMGATTPIKIPPVDPPAPGNIEPAPPVEKVVAGRATPVKPMPMPGDPVTPPSDTESKNDA